MRKTQLLVFVVAGLLVAITYLHWGMGLPTIEDANRNHKTGDTLPIDGNWLQFTSGGVLQPTTVRFERGVGYVLNSPMIQQGRVFITDIKPIRTRQSVGQEPLDYTGFTGVRIDTITRNPVKIALIIEAPNLVSEYLVHPASARNNGAEMPRMKYILLRPDDSAALDASYKPHPHPFGNHFFVENPNLKE
jgi:hypothetical protein